jgi:hypothetical protein
LPFICGYVEDPEGSSGTEPAFGHFFEIFEAVDDVSLGVFVGEVEEVDCACCMSDVDCDVADLF